MNVIESRGREPHLDLDLVADLRNNVAGREMDHAHLHVRRLDEPPLSTAHDVRRQRQSGSVEPALRQGAGAVAGRGRG
jgi:hypothetical protein